MGSNLKEVCWTLRRSQPVTRWFGAAVVGSLMTVLAGLMPSLAHPQIIGPDARILSGVTRSNGTEMGPQLSFKGNIGIAIWYEDGGAGPVHSAYTADGGETWIPGGFLPGESDDLGACTVCAGPEGRFHVLNRRAVSNGLDLEARRGELSGGAFVWQPAIQLATAASSEYPTIACDPMGGDVYVTYTHAFLVSTSPLVFSATVQFTRSSDGGATWSAPVALSPATCNGSNIAVGPGGEVYVVWQDFATAQVMLRRSLDHGASFEPAVVVGPVLENANTSVPGFTSGGGRTHTTWPHAMKVPHYPVLAVDRSPGPRRGTLYVAWAEMASGTVGPSLGSVSESEPNNYFANANAIEIGQELVGTVESADVQPDWDYWTFEGSAGQTVTLDGSFRYYPPPGVFLESFGVLACGQDTLQAFDIVRSRHTDQVTPPLVFTLPYSGRYYIPVYGAGAYAVDYRIQLREVQLDAGSVARDHRDLVLTTSADGGQSWTSKVRVSGGPERFDDVLPALAVDDAGQLHVAWYGRQDDPICGILANTYWTLSRDGGAGFLSPRRVSSVGSRWNYSSGDHSLAGDRLALATNGTTAQVMWMDSRALATSSTDIYGARIEAGPPTATVVARFSADGLAAGIRLRWRIDDRTEVVGFRLRRSRDEGVWEEPAVDLPGPAAGPEFEALDAGALAGVRYSYRLEVQFAGGSSLWAGPVEATRPAAAGSLTLALAPNPARGPVAITVALPEAGPLSVAVFDVAGKVVADLYEGLAAAGPLELRWEGRAREGHLAPPGLYWVRVQLAGRQLVRRLARME